MLLLLVGNDVAQTTRVAHRSSGYLCTCFRGVVKSHCEARRTHLCASLWRVPISNYTLGDGKNVERRSSGVKPPLLAFRQTFWRTLLNDLKREGIGTVLVPSILEWCRLVYVSVEKASVATPALFYVARLPDVAPTIKKCNLVDPRDRAYPHGSTAGISHEMSTVSPIVSVTPVPDAVAALLIVMVL